MLGFGGPDGVCLILKRCVSLICVASCDKQAVCLTDQTLPKFTLNNIATIPQESHRIALMNRPQLALMFSVRLIDSCEPANGVHSLRSQAMATKKINKKADKKKAVSRRTSAKATTASEATSGASTATRQSKSRPAKHDRPKRISGLDLAADVLAKSGKPLNAKAIAERVIAAGWKTDGKTPHATLYSAIIREITTKKEAARFRKTDRGQFVAARGAM